MTLQTFTGRQVAPLRPVAADIVIEDIAHALSLLCRFGGHVRTFYSVAQHAVLASRIVPEADALWALLHDASEAYLVDLPTPVKRLAACDGYRLVEAQLQRTIYQAFGLAGNEPESVGVADRALVVAEAEALLHAGAAWCTADVRAEAAALAARVVPVASDVAERAFLKRFRQLTGGR